MNAFAAVLLIITKILENLFSTNGLTTTHDTLTPVGSLVFFYDSNSDDQYVAKNNFNQKNIQEKKGE